MNTQTQTPVTWTSNGRESATHLAAEWTDSIRNGQFPLLCGRWAPDGFDADIQQRTGRSQCRKCYSKREVKA